MPGGRSVDLLRNNCRRRRRLCFRVRHNGLGLNFWLRSRHRHYLFFLYFRVPFRHVILHLRIRPAFRASAGASVPVKPPPEHFRHVVIH